MIAVNTGRNRILKNGTDPVDRDPQYLFIPFIKLELSLQVPDPLLFGVENGKETLDEQGLHLAGLLDHQQRSQIPEKNTIWKKFIFRKIRQRLFI